MRKINTLIIALLLVVGSIAQSPQAFRYQAIVRGEAGNVLTNNPVGLKISMVEGNRDGMAKYVETHTLHSDPNGMINLVIGEGRTEMGDFNKINWGEDSYFVKIEIDITGGTDYEEMGTTQLYAVPYALYAEEAGGIARKENNTTSQNKAKSQIPKANSQKDTRNASSNSKFPADGNSWLNVDTANVGIGTTTPTEKLEVNGNIKTNGTIFIDDGFILLDSWGNPQHVVLHPNGTWSLRFDCKGKIKDIRDNNHYAITKIGTQCWMAENLNIGTRVDGIIDQTKNDLIEKFCYDDDDNNCTVYGGLYEWDEAMEYYTIDSARGICPPGWHIPSDNEWKILEGSVDSDYGIDNTEWDEIGWRGFDAGFHIKSNVGWNHSGNGNDSCGFTALPGGYWLFTGSFFHIGNMAFFWSSTEIDLTYAFYRSLYHSFDEVGRDNGNRNSGYSVRCLKDFTCGDSITDYRDLKHYGTVKIGYQCWMAQNINIGTRIDANIDQMNTGIIEKYCNSNHEDSCDQYGGLYQWGEAMQYETTDGAIGICPDGWHLPTNDEWKVLEGTVDSKFGVGDPEWENTPSRGYDAGKNLKSAYEWRLNGNGADLFNYKARSGGYSFYDGSGFISIGNIASFWTSTESIDSKAWARELIYDHDDVTSTIFGQSYGFSVRCLMDE